MGGFVFDASDEEPFLQERSRQGNGTRITLAPDGAAFLMQHAPHVLPRLSKEAILD